MDYIKGSHYSRFLTVEPEKKHGTHVTWVKNTNYGFLFRMFNNYITLYYGRLQINANGTAKARIKVNRNYSTPYQYTIYFDKQGFEIQTKENSTRKELSIYKSLNR